MITKNAYVKTLSYIKTLHPRFSRRFFNIATALVIMPTNLGIASLSRRTEFIPFLPDGFEPEKKIPTIEVWVGMM